MSEADGMPLMEALRQSGAARFDAVRWHHAEALARRAAASEGKVRQLLDAKLTQILHALDACFRQGQDEARDALAAAAESHPEASAELHSLFAAGEFKRLHEAIAALRKPVPTDTLASLLRDLAHHDHQATPSWAPSSSDLPLELKAVSQFRDTWAKLSADKQVTQALQQAPKNAGPINSHMLVLRSLALMRDMSPEYLNRFLSYADTLLKLEQGEGEKTVAVKRGGKGGKAMRK
ncbi:DUF2894 domain-containing protein [Noviherbaspirillum galbum]|uniref:DUF2894 domain-containing protein n=1 Tax=Noviherbaspirillum galbum TaxID=2709383 RepID=A0A6B3SY43_9BURK|nr:DUF2894 domain-containing protein [Noviherbaspirillum galbum]NEX64176.1 DUF2894 domain-containing protein [Noviherbaspirillum galbum]